MANDGFILNSIRKSDELTSKLSERLSTGKRVNKAKDDAAGLQIIASLEASNVTLRQGVRNSYDGISTLEIADNSYKQLEDVGIRMQELATESANGTLSDAQRSTINTEYQQLLEESQRIVDTTEFNGKKLISNDGFIVQTGNDSSENSRLEVNGGNVLSSLGALSTQDISTQENALKSMAPLEEHLKNVVAKRGEIGATYSRLSTSIENSNSAYEAQASAVSSIRDADLAETLSQKISADIRKETGIALLAQNNLSKDIVLKLLG